MHVKARLTVCCRAAREALAAKQRVEAEHRRAAELAASEGQCCSVRQPLGVTGVKRMTSGAGFPVLRTRLRLWVGRH